MRLQSIWSRDFRSWRLVGSFALVLPCVFALFTYDPAQSDIFPPCPFRFLTGFDCPGCGTLRGLHQLLRGNILSALDLNVMMVLTLPYLGISLLTVLAADFTGRDVVRVPVPATLVWGILATIILFWVARNIPVYPFTVLAS